MAATKYAGPEPITGLWVLDNGLELRHFNSTEALAEAFLGGYGEPVGKSRRKRPPNLQWFGADGYCDASPLASTRPPKGLADDGNLDEVHNARIKFNNGDKAEWLALRKQGDLQRKTYKKELIGKLDAFRNAHLRAVAKP